MAELLLSLAAKDSEAAAVQSAASKFPTATLARLELSGPWASLGRGGARLTHVLQPKELGDEP